MRKAYYFYSPLPPAPKSQLLPLTIICRLPLPPCSSSSGIFCSVTCHKFALGWGLGAVIVPRGQLLLFLLVAAFVTSTSTTAASIGPFLLCLHNLGFEFLDTLLLVLNLCLGLGGGGTGVIA